MDLQWAPGSGGPPPQLTVEEVDWSAANKDCATDGFSITPTSGTVGTTFTVTIPPDASWAANWVGPCEWGFHDPTDPGPAAYDAVFEINYTG
jgi:hypothetical protein